MHKIQIRLINFLSKQYAARTFAFHGTRVVFLSNSEQLIEINYASRVVENSIASFPITTHDTKSISSKITQIQMNKSGIYLLTGNITRVRKIVR